MTTPNAPHQTPPSLRTILHRIWEFVSGHGRLPSWAVLLIVLFGSGGIFYAFRDYLNRQQPGPPPVYKGGLSLPVNVEASFFPPVHTSLASGVYVEIENTGTWTIPNLKAVLDTQSAKIQSCELKTAAKLASPAQESNDTTYVMQIATLLPGERLELYCLAENPQQLSVALNSVDDVGANLAHANDSFTRSTKADEHSGFFDFLEVIAGTVIIAFAGCIIYFLFGLAGKLAGRLRLFAK